MTPDTLLDLLAAHLDEMEALAARYQRIGMAGTAERVTEPQGEGVGDE